MYALLFVLGISLGSFVNVVTMRYREDKFLLNGKVIGGRSACPKCGEELRWYELIPLASFLWQAGRCRSCRGKISLQYPLVELASGLIFIFVPWRLASFYALTLHLSLPYFTLAALIWISAFLALLAITVIDIRTRLIPDEANAFLALGGVALGLLEINFGASRRDSFLGPYALLFGAEKNIFLNLILAAALGALFFGLLIFISRGRGMGMGDMKFAAALGLLFGWPDIILAVALAFITGSLAGLLEMALGRKTMKGALPFGPFLSLGAALVFFLGYDIVRFYFGLFPSL